MNDTHKLLLAICEALDLDVKEIRTPKGRDFGSFGGSPAHVPVMKCSGGLWRQFDVDYKVTKKKENVTMFHCQLTRKHLAVW